VSVVRIREGRIIEGFLNRKYVRILSGHRKLSVIERYPEGEVQLNLRSGSIFVSLGETFSFRSVKHSGGTGETQ